jgi:hypothetical protein
MKKHQYFITALLAVAAIAAAFIPTFAQAVQHGIAYVGLDNLSGMAMAGTTLAANLPRAFETGSRNEFPVIASDIIFEGAAVGLVDASGHARPLTSADRFVGFAEAKADNSAGAAAAIGVRTIESGKIQLTVSGAVITDIGQPVYATDDNTFTFLPVGAVFIGFVHRFVAANTVVVRFDAPAFQDPYGDTVRETVSDNLTTDIEDTGKTLFVDTDAKTITLLTYAAATAHRLKVVNIGSFGALAVSIDPAAGDKIAGPNDTGADGGLLVNTKATARRGDYVVLTSGGDDGYIVEEIRGTWTIA